MRCSFRSCQPDSPWRFGIRGGSNLDQVVLDGITVEASIEVDVLPACIDPHTISTFPLVGCYRKACGDVHESTFDAHSDSEKVVSEQREQKLRVLSTDQFPDYWTVPGSA